MRVIFFRPRISPGIKMSEVHFFELRNAYSVCCQEFSDRSN